MLPTTPALARSAANSQLGLERVGKTLVPGVIRAGQWVDVADPSHGEERGEGCCVSACLSAHPWRATPPPRQLHGEERGERCRVSACLAAHPWRATPPPRQPKQLNSNNRAELGWEGCVGQVDGNRPPEEGAFHTFPRQPLTAE